MRNAAPIFVLILKCNPLPNTGSFRKNTTLSHIFFIHFIDKKIIIELPPPPTPSNYGTDTYVDLRMKNIKV